MTGIYLKPGEVGEISLKQNTNLRRGEDIDRLLLPPLLDHLLWLLIGEQRGPNTLIRGKEDVRRRLLPPLQVIL